MDSTEVSADERPPEGRTQTSFTESVKFTDIEQVLADQFGERFRLYRRDFHKSLNYDENNFLPDFPITVSMELVNRCNLSCIMCYTINHEEKKTTLKRPTIARVLSECEARGLPALVVGLGAEPLLYKGAREVLSTARDAGVMDIFLGTNGVLLTEQMSTFLVERRIARLEVSLDAATPETYHKIRGKNQLDLIEENLHKFLEVRKRMGARLPVLRLCFCVQEANLHEREAFLKKWEKHADYIDFQKLFDFTPIDELRATGTVSGVEELVVEDTHCAYPFNSLHIWSNGNVTPCCTFFAKNDDLVVGNVQEQTLKDIWEGEPIKEIRQQLMSGELNPTCRVCLAQRDAERFEEVKRQNRDDGYGG